MKRTAKKTATKASLKVVREPRLCACGCHKLTSGADFRPGHDMRLRGQIRRGETLKPESRQFVARHRAAHGTDPHYEAPSKVAKVSRPSKVVKKAQPSRLLPHAKGATTQQTTDAIDASLAAKGAV